MGRFCSSKIIIKLKDFIKDIEYIPIWTNGTRLRKHLEKYYSQNYIMHKTKEHKITNKDQRMTGTSTLVCVGACEKW